MTDQFKQLVRARLLIVRIVWVIITGSVVFYFFITYLLTLENTGVGVRAVSGAAPAFYIAAAVVAVISVIFRIWSFSRGRIGEILGNYRPDTLASDAATKHARPDGMDNTETLSESEKRTLFLLNELQKYSLINMILNEMVIMIGFVFAFISEDFVKIVPFGAASLLLCLWMFPRAGSVAEKAQITFK
ncbi:MAG TPA: hypothetical protein VHC46_10100 [Thermodesulfobacteriota bacterium]|nr:hypothetical protein [Thermodesulfobacteriota bacterium]